MQVDFAKNYALKQQTKVCIGVTSKVVFTANSWISAEKAKSFALVSKELTHGKISVYKFIDQLLEMITEEYGKVAEVKIFSDGPASQYKQNYPFSNLHSMRATAKSGAVVNTAEEFTSITQEAYPNIRYQFLLFLSILRGWYGITTLKNPFL